jgi:hypothetical protein
MEPMYPVGPSSGPTASRTSQRTIVQKKGKQAKQRGLKESLLGTADRPTHINSPVAGQRFFMAKPVYGFRPECAWPGVMFQVFLQGTYVATWQKQKQLEFWIVFDNQRRKAAFFEVDSDVSLPDIGTKRYILQCLVPEVVWREGNSCPVNLTVHGDGGKMIASGLLIGQFQWKPNGIPQPLCAN